MRWERSGIGMLTIPFIKFTETAVKVNSGLLQRRPRQN